MKGARSPQYISMTRDRTRGTDSSPVNDRRLRHVAVHEAGHAVASHYLGTPLRHVTVTRDKKGKTLGHTRQRWVWFQDKRGVLDVSPRGRDHVERHILVSLAGQLALRRYAPRSRWQTGSERDTWQAIELYWLICDKDEKAAKLYLALLWRRAEWLIEAKWKDVLAVADALLERGTLKADELGRVILGRRSRAAARRPSRRP
jgi:hypothetical protein